MVEPVNSSSVAAVQQAPAEREDVQRQEEELQQQEVQQNPPQDSVTIRAAEANEQANASRTAIENEDQARETADRIANLFQEKPELAATAQGGNLTAEKADAYLTANF